jgi:hypothetical protein
MPNGEITKKKIRKNIDMGMNKRKAAVCDLFGLTGEN